MPELSPWVGPLVNQKGVLWEEGRRPILVAGSLLRCGAALTGGVGPGASSRLSCGRLPRSSVSGKARGL